MASPGIAIAALGPRAVAAGETAQACRASTGTSPRRASGPARARRRGRRPSPSCTGCAWACSGLREEGRERTWARHASDRSRRSRAGLEALGLRLVAAPTDRSRHRDRRLAARRHRVGDRSTPPCAAAGLVIAGGQGKWVGQILRFGHMGEVGIDEMAEATRDHGRDPARRSAIRGRWRRRGPAAAREAFEAATAAGVTEPAPRSSSVTASPTGTARADCRAISIPRCRRAAAARRAGRPDRLAADRGPAPGAHPLLDRCARVRDRGDRSAAPLASSRARPAAGRDRRRASGRGGPTPSSAGAPTASGTGRGARRRGMRPPPGGEPISERHRSELPTVLADVTRRAHVAGAASSATAGRCASWPALLLDLDAERAEPRHRQCVGLGRVRATRRCGASNAGTTRSTCSAASARTSTRPRDGRWRSEARPTRRGGRTRSGPSRRTAEPR